MVTRVNDISITMAGVRQGYVRVRVRVRVRVSWRGSR